MKSLASRFADSSANASSSDEIGQCACELWTSIGQPAGRDNAIWLQAEARLAEVRRQESAQPPRSFRKAALLRPGTRPPMAAIFGGAPA